MPAIAADGGTPRTAPEWIPSPLYRLTLDQYEAMVASGAFTGKERFHLINGYLVAKMTQNEPHATADELCGQALARIVPDGWHVRAAKPIRIPSMASKPEPDRCVARGTIRDYARVSPEPADIAMVVEIADSSLGEDRKQAALYGGAGIPEYWIVNLADRQIEVYSTPAGEGYQARKDYPAGSAVPVIIAGSEVGRIAVNDLLP
jgi:Uma2 family endonuclease